MSASVHPWVVDSVSFVDSVASVVSPLVVSVALEVVPGLVVTVVAPEGLFDDDVCGRSVQLERDRPTTAVTITAIDRGAIVGATVRAPQNGHKPSIFSM